MRLLHTMLRVGDLQKSIDFYTNVLGMKLLRQKDYPAGEFTLAFLGYGDEDSNTVLELTYNWGVEAYDLGSGYGHIAIEVPDVVPCWFFQQHCETLKENRCENESCCGLVVI